MSDQIQNQIELLKSLLGDVETNKSKIIELYYTISNEESTEALDAVPFLNESAKQLLSTEVITILRKHRLDAYSYILVANKLLELENLKNDLIHGNVLVDTASQRTVNNLIKELGIQLSQNKTSATSTTTSEPGRVQIQFKQEEVKLPETRLAYEIRKQCTDSKSESGMTIYQLPLEETSTFPEAPEILKRLSFGKPNDLMNTISKTVLLMGATGSGKTTMINAMINYVLGVERSDPFRFVLVEEKVRESQAFSQTKGITAYDIHHREGFRIPYSLTIVDTPGFGDCDGIGRDMEITSAIKQFFEHLNGIQVGLHDNNSIFL